MVFCGARQTASEWTNSARSAAVARLPWKHFRTPLEPIVVGMLRVAAKPPCRANEAAREAKTTNTAKANFAEMFDIGESSMIKFTRTRMLVRPLYVRNPSTPIHQNL